MQNEDNACIRYLMKEMDPSEELLMERAMMEDDDLLIEVESLRQTLKRLDELPEVEPPAHISESILRQAAEEGEKKRQRQANIFSFNPIKYAAAAVLLVGFSMGGFWIYQQSDSGTGDSAQAGVSNSVSVQSSTPVLPVSVQKTEPWVDRQNVIRLNDRYQQTNTEFDSILKTSTNKLTPLNDPFYLNDRPRSLQMTGSGNN